jgi:hypothetical protein
MPNKIFIKSLTKSICIYLITKLFKKSVPQGNLVAGKIRMSNIQTNDFYMKKLSLAFHSWLDVTVVAKMMF